MPLFLISLLPVAAALLVASTVPDSTIDLDHHREQTILVLVVGLIALAPVIEVVGHEMVGYRHTIRVLAREGVLESTELADTTFGRDAE